MSRFFAAKAATRSTHRYVEIMIELEGTPQILDAVLRPIGRAVQLLLGLSISAVLAFFQAWWWAPVPLALSFLVYEVVFWWRGDRPATLSLGRVITLHDSVRGQTITINPEDIEVATLHYRRSPKARSKGAERQEVYVVLGGFEGAKLAIRFTVDPTAWRPASGDVDIDTMDRITGGYAGLLRAVAPGTAIARQTFDDPAGQVIRWLRQRIPEPAWKRIGLRVWKGEAPPLDAFGHHTDEPSGWLVIARDRYRLLLDGEIHRGDITLIRSARAERSAALMMDDGKGGHRIQTTQLPMLVLELDDAIDLAFPSPVDGGGIGNAHELDEHCLHTHVPEGAALVWHILTTWPRTTWPAALRQRVQAAAPPSSPLFNALES